MSASSASSRSSGPWHPHDSCMRAPSTLLATATLPAHRRCFHASQPSCTASLCAPRTSRCSLAPRSDTYGTESWQTVRICSESTHKPRVTWLGCTTSFERRFCDSATHRAKPTRRSPSAQADSRALRPLRAVAQRADWRRCRPSCRSAQTYERIVGSHGVGTREYGAHVTPARGTRTRGAYATVSRA